MNKRKIAISLAVITTIGVFIGLYWSPSALSLPTPTADPTKAPVSSAVEANPHPSTLQDSSTDEADHRQGTPLQLDQLLFASSLEGTDIDGHLRADADGNLVIELASRDFFDYFLATSTEVGVETAIDEILRYIDTYLPEPALQQARELFSQYLRYKKFTIELQRTPITGSMDTEGYINLLRDTFAKQKSARREIFSPQANQAFFGLEDQYAQYTLENMSIQNNADLSNAEKAKLLTENRATLPFDVQATLKNHESSTATSQEASKLVNSQLGDTEVYSKLVNQGYDQSKAAEILSYRQQQDSFEQRYKSYRIIKGELKSKDLPQRELNDAVQTLQRQFFISEQEQTQAKLRDLSD